MGATPVKDAKKQNKRRKLPKRGRGRSKKIKIRQIPITDAESKSHQAEKKDEVPSSPQVTGEAPPAEPEKQELQEKSEKQATTERTSNSAKAETSEKHLFVEEGPVRLGNSPLCATHTREYLIFVDDLERKERQHYEDVRK